MAFDYKKEYKEFYMPKNKPGIIEIPKMNYIAVRGKGNPNEENGEYKNSIGLLYGIAFTIKMSYKGTHKIEGFFEYVVPPLEGLWWQENTQGLDYARKEDMHFISMIRLPDFVTKEDFEWAVQEATKKKKQDFSKVEFFPYDEGLCVQCMHIGSYDDEPATVDLMHDYNILMSANWQMMAMLNILISICGACMMYHTEYADNGMQKMSVLPIRQGSMFFGKFLIAALVLSAMVVIEMAVLVGCAKYWFPSYVFDLTEILKTAGFQIIVTLPTVMLMLVIASACKNMWVSLGIGVILVFTLSILPQDNIVLSLFPFASPYQMLSAAVENSRTTLFLAVCGIETVVFGITEVLYLKVRRCFE